MSLKEQLLSDIKEAMKSKDSVKLGTVRSVISAVKNQAIDSKRELNEEEILVLVSRAVKKRKEAAALFTKITNEAGLDKANFDVEGPQLASSFTVRMGGQPDTASRYVRQILDAQKESKTVWKKYFVKNASNDIVISRCLMRCKKNTNF